jgi:hypothetical protein
MLNGHATLLFATVLFLAGCAVNPTKEFAGAVKNAKQAGRALVIFQTYPTPGWGRQRLPGYGVQVGVDFITTSATTLQSILFDFLPYDLVGNPQRSKIKRFKAKGPFFPNHVYRLRNPQLVWTGTLHNYCVTPIGMTIKEVDGTVIRVDRKDIVQYMVPAIRVGCRAKPGFIF